jgi:hypothetical protein
MQHPILYARCRHLAEAEVQPRSDPRAGLKRRFFTRQGGWKDQNGTSERRLGGIDR